MNKKILLSFTVISAFLLTGCSWRKKAVPVIPQEEVIEEEVIETNIEGLANEVPLVEPESIFEEDGEDLVIEAEIESGENPLIQISVEREKPQRLVIKEQQNKLEQVGIIYFDFDKYTIRTDQGIEAKRIANFLKDHPKAKIFIKGHACNSAGSDKYNLQLSHYRAVAFEKYLINAGIAADRISLQGCGTSEMIVLAGDEMAQAPNRRVEVFLVH